VWVVVGLEDWAAEDRLKAVLPIIRGEMSREEQAANLMVSEKVLQRWQEQVSDAVLEVTSRLW
jgi:hypothetical protein